jgi:unsaturated rhamnogalacturonyl hydrolase
MTKRSLTSVLTLILLGLAICPAKAAEGKTLIIITRNKQSRPAGEKARIVVDWKELYAKAPFVANGLALTDGNFGKPVSFKLLDNNKDGAIDQLLVDFIFSSDEPVFSLTVTPSGQLPAVQNGAEAVDPQVRVQVLMTSSHWLKSGKGATNWADKIIESTMAFYPDPATLPVYAPGKYSYEYAFFMNAILQRYEEIKKAEYLAYVRKWADRFIDSHGMLDPRHYDVEEYQLDHILPGRVFLSLFKITNNEKYKNTAMQLKNQLTYQPRTSEGGYWHKQIYPNQMWLDGIYMADVFSMQYAAAFNEPRHFNDAAKQIKLMWAHTFDASKGLMYHGWDESYNKVWADPERGTSPEFWSRAIGWYMMAIVDGSDFLPIDHPNRKEIGGMLKELGKGVKNYQDKKTGLWFQVTDKGEQPGNWIETSGSAMFAYAFAKGERKGFFDKSYRSAAQQAFDALTKDYVFFDDDGKLYMDQTVKIGTLNVKTSRGDYDYYITTERRINDYKGLASLLYLSQELD